jgi:hypothetical protein
MVNFFMIGYASRGHSDSTIIRLGEIWLGICLQLGTVAGIRRSTVAYSRNFVIESLQVPLIKSLAISARYTSVSGRILLITENCYRTPGPGLKKA